MNNHKQEQTISYKVHYLTIDNDNKTTHTVYDIDECDFVLIRKREFESKHTGDPFEFVRIYVKVPDANRSGSLLPQSML